MSEPAASLRHSRCGAGVTCAYWHIQSVFEELYLVEDIPIRTMLLEISTAAKYNDQKAHADELLDTHNLSADAQGVLKETTQ